MMDQLNIEMNSVCTVIDQFLEESDSMVRIPVRRTAEKKGKLLRPLLLVLTASCGKHNMQTTIRAASALELMHIASLIHDDIVDEGALRRGTVSVQSEFGKDVAVYAGDYTLAKSISILTALHDMRLITMFNKAMTTLCRGEIKQHMCRYHYLSNEEYIEIVSQKTGELFALSLEAGGYLGGMDAEVCAALQDIGRKLGVAYQIYDDCLDYTAPGSQALKDTHKDIRQGSYTLPLLCALENDASANLQRVLSTSLNDDILFDINQMVVELDGAEIAMGYAMEYFNRVLQDIKMLSFKKNIDFDELIHGIEALITTTCAVANISIEETIPSGVAVG
ncbi:polyprenyl synthetase family protein [Spirochaetota bacterium]